MMGESISDKIIDEVKKQFIEELAKQGRRLDNREWNERRETVIIDNPISSADGSAFVRLGHTQVLVGIKVQVGEPFPDTPDQGVLTVSAELLPLASNMFEPGPPDERSIELARVVDRGIRSSEMIDFKELFIEENTVYLLFVDIHVLDYDGNLFDAAYEAANRALKNTRLPAYEDGQLNREKTTPLNLKYEVSSNTFVKIAGRIFLDPTALEEKAASARFTVAKRSDGNICAMQKAGPGGFTADEIKRMVLEF